MVKNKIKTSSIAAALKMEMYDWDFGKTDCRVIARFAHIKFDIEWKNKKGIEESQ